MSWSIIVPGANSASEINNDSSVPGGSVADALNNLDMLHFGAYTILTIAVGVDPNAPTYLSGVALFPSSSPEFTLLDAATGLIRNDSLRTVSMQGTATYQTVQGVGGIGELILWSERSLDDGLTFEENEFSLRTSEIPNNSSSSQTKSSAVSSWAPGESIRWAMYNAGVGSVSLDSPTATVNGGNVVDGLSFYWQLNEV